MKIPLVRLLVGIVVAAAGVFIALGAAMSDSRSSGIRFTQFKEPLKPVVKADPVMTDKHTLQLRELAKSLQLSARPASAPTEAMIREQVADLEQFIIDNPESPYVPDLHRQLGNWHRERGAYSRAYEHWKTAYETTVALDDPFGKLLTEESLASLAQLMASLGRLEELLPLIQENKERTFSRPATAQIWTRTLEATGVMRRNASIAYKCGVYALVNVAKEMTGETYVPIASQPSSVNGFSLGELYELVKKHRLGLSPAFKSPGAPIVVPSVVHWKLNHYAAIVSEHEGLYLVKDPTFGSAIWMDAATIENEASGYFMIPTLASTGGWRWASTLELGQVYGKGYPWFMLDPLPPTQCPTNNGGSGPPGTGGTNGCSNSGMPTWSVVEPNINLKVSDIPMFYDAAIGPSFVVHLTWQQRDPFTTSGSKVAHLADGWRADLASWIEGYPFKFQGTAANQFVLKSGDGRQLQYQFQSGSLASDREFVTGTWAVRTVSGSDVTEVNVYYTNGARERYLPNATGYNFFLKERYSATMKAMSFTYDDPDGGVDYQRLTKVTTADGQDFNFQYTDTNDTSRVTGVTGPNSRSITFTYSTISSAVVLTGITDAAGITSTIGYDTSTWWINRIVTPYGTNTFTHFDATACTRYALDCIGVDRAILINEPAGTRQAYLFYDSNNYPDYTNEFPGVIPDNFAASQIPVYLSGDPPVQTLDTIRFGRNSHHWNRQQAAALSTTNWANLTAADYRISHTKHWLSGDEWAVPIESALISLGWELPASGDGTTESQPIFYDYPGKPSGFEYYRGTNSLPAVISRRMPDGTTYYQYIERNQQGMATRTTERWVESGTVTYRTNTFTYASGTGNSAVDGLLLVKHVGPLGELVVGRALHPTYGDQVKYETNAVGEVVTYDYNSDRNITTRQTHAGLLSTYTYNSTSKRLEKVVDSISGTAIRTNSYTWLNGYPRTHTDPRGMTRTFDYDFLGRLTKNAYPDGTYEEYFYVLPAATGFNTSGSPIAVIDHVATRDRLGSYWYFLPNRNRQTEKIIEPAKISGGSGTEKTISYCGCGSPSSITAASNTGSSETTSLSFNYLGQPTIVSLPDGTYFTNRYDAIGRLIGRDDAYMKITNSWDNLGRLSSMVNGAGLLNGYTYNRNGWMMSSTNANGAWRTNAYDNLGRLTVSVQPDGGVERWVYTTGFPQATAFTNQVSDVTTWAYDASLRQTNEIVVGMFTNSFAYNGANDLVELYDGRQTGTTNRTQWRFDSYGRTTAKLYADGVTNLTYAYDALNRITNRWTKAKGNTKYAYDSVGNLTNVDYAVTADRKFVYDAHNRVSSDIVAGVITNTYAYIAGGSLSYEETPQWASSRVTFGYTSLLRTSLTLQQPTIGNWSQTYAYDLARRMTNIGGTAGTFTHSYVSAAGTTASRLIQNITVPTTSSGTLVTNLYDTTGRLTSTQLRNGSTIYNTHSYQINAAHQRTRQTRTDGSYVNYTYDDAEQLSTALTYTSGGTAVSAENFGYAYDASQNMVRRTNNVTTTTYPVNGLNQATGPDNLVYDYNGNRTSRNAYDVYAYDDENQLVTVNRGNSARSEFVYDARGRLRIAREYTWSAGTAAALIANGAITATTRNNFTGLVGTVIQVGSSPVVVTELGRWKLAGNTGTHAVKIVRYSDWSDVPGATASVNLSGGTAGTFVYGSLASPVVLEANTLYHIVTAETNGGDTWYDWNQPITGSGGISSVSTVWSYGDGIYTTYGNMSQSYGPVGIKGATGTWNLSSETRFIYDGMQIIQERNSSNVPQVTYTRGMDLARSREKAGGIGGLRARTAHSGANGATLAHAFYHSDGNGNVTYIINPNQSQAAAYVYDPYGRLISSTGSLASANTMRFSSKLWLGNNVDLYYFGYRFYDPTTQRWLNRDLIQERGGVNLYSFLNGKVIGSVDPLGMSGFDELTGEDSGQCDSRPTPSPSPWNDWSRGAEMGPQPPSDLGEVLGELLSEIGPSICSSCSSMFPEFVNDSLTSSLGNLTPSFEFSLGGGTGSSGRDLPSVNFSSQVTPSGLPALQVGINIPIIGPVGLDLGADVGSGKPDFSIGIGCSISW